MPKRAAYYTDRLPSWLDKELARSTSLVSRIAREFRNELVTALGGEGQLTPQQRITIDRIVRAQVYVTALDGELLRAESITYKNKDGALSMIPLLKDWTALSDRMLKWVETLGLQRVPQRVPSLEDLAADWGPGPTQDELDAQNETTPDLGAEPERAQEKVPVQEAPADLDDELLPPERP